MGCMLRTSAARLGTTVVLVVAGAALMTASAAGGTTARPQAGGQLAEHLVGPAAAHQRLDVTLHFTPRHRAALDRLAGAPGHRPVASARLQALFGPAAATTGAADRYMARHGFTRVSGGILTRTYAGT